MEHFFTCNSAACISCICTSCSYTTDINTFLEQYDDFIRIVARQNVSRPRAALTDEIEKDIDDLAQHTRIKLWFALKNKCCCYISNMRAYIRRIVRNVVIDLSRRYKPVESLITNDDGEIAQTYRLVASSQRAQNPFEVIEQEEMLESYSSKLSEEVLELPPGQQRAMICSLKEQISDILSVVEIFESYGLDVENIAWPLAENERRSSRTSLSIARKKLRATRQEADWY